MSRELLKEFLNYLAKVNETSYISFYHGITHWQHVEAFGLMMAEQCPAADKEVIRWFAYLHDSMRGSDSTEISHGAAAAKFIRKIRNTFLKDLTDEQIRILKLACKSHNVRRRTGDLTADICLDADRLDLPRVGIKPEPRKMASKIGSEFALIPYDELLARAGFGEEFKIDF